MKIVSTELMPFESQSYGAVISRNVVAARARTRMSQSALAERMRALGYSWYPQTVGAVERGERRLEIGELLAAALALETSIGALLDPSPDDPFVELPSGKRVQVGTVQRSVRHFNDGIVWWDDSTPRFESANPEGRDWPVEDMSSLEAFDTPENWQRRAARLGPRPVKAQDVQPPPELRPARQQHGVPAHVPVIVAVVTSAKGVLIGRRNDGIPPWTFIAGAQMAGESPEDTIIREVKEEACLDIRSADRIGQRVHPATGRNLIYFAAQPAHGTRIAVGDEAELAEVRWVSLAEAAELMPDMFAPVREHLARAIGGDS